MRKTHTSIQGTWAYEAKSLIDSKQLVPGSELRLLCEPENKFDRNAVVVLIHSYKIGNLPKDLAAELNNYLSASKKYGAKVTNIGERKHGNRTYPTISIDIFLYEMAPDREFSRLLAEASGLNGVSGVYEISDKESGKSYIGSSKNVGNRLRQHLHSLKSGLHANEGLASAWATHGPEGLQFSLLEKCAENHLKSREAASIRIHQTHIHGFNRTRDGSGSKPPPTTVARRPSKNKAPTSNTSPQQFTAEKNSGCFIVLLALVGIGGIIKLIL